ncbi:MAG: SRPBCC family protein [Chloroflexi bacterium]|nr:SRPBCC family protein [Chloroflexota bacterium]MDA1298056.1 SRPBCC family protein [Chloroflexota bacterium]
MPSGTVIAEFPATVERVWEKIADLENAPSWVPDLISVRRLDSGPTQTGSRFAEVARVQGREIEMVVTITDYAEPHVIAHEGEGGSVKIGGRTTIDATPTGCRVTNEWRLELSGILRFASPIAGNWTRNNIETSMRELRALLDREDGPA